MKKTDKIAALAIFLIALGLSINYSFRIWEISGDSIREYNTYLEFTNYVFWRPLTDNILSTSLFTTYFPAVVQRLFHLDNPEIIYRAFVAVMVAHK